MLGKLKNLAGSAALKPVVDKVTPMLEPHLEKIKALSPAAVQDDEQFKTTLIAPTLTAIAASTSGVTKMIPKFDEKFTNAMLHLRDELIIFDGNSVKLVDGFQGKLPTVLLEGLKK